MLNLVIGVFGHPPPFVRTQTTVRHIGRSICHPGYRIYLAAEVTPSDHKRYMVELVRTYVDVL